VGFALVQPGAAQATDTPESVPETLAETVPDAQPTAMEPADPTESQPTPLPAAVPPPPADTIDMTPFQKAYDLEVAAEQAEATGATANLPPGEKPAQAGDSDIFTMAMRSLAALLAICATILVLGWAAKRWGSRTPLLAGAGLAQVMGRTYLEPKICLHYVKTGGRVLVIGVTPNSINLITEFDADQFETVAAPLPEAPRTATAADAFLARLREQQERGATLATPTTADDLDSLRGDIQRLKQFLQESRRGTGL
jgi:flagellar biogenesis protein FliO